jgi:DNA-3-methyladenine glycosylase
LSGVEEMKKRRRREELVELCSGPAKLTQALGIDRSLDGVDLVSGERLYVVRGRADAPVGVSARIGVAYARGWAKKPLRFFLRGNPNVSR